MSRTFRISEESMELLIRVSLNRSMTKEQALARAFAYLKIAEDALCNGEELAVVSFNEEGNISKFRKINGQRKYESN